jgi:hypothetical protein
MKKICIAVLACALVASCARQPGSGKAQLLLHLSVDRSHRPGQADLRDVEILLDVRNPSDGDLGLDRRRLNPILGADIRDVRGQLVPNMPGAVPQEFGARHSMRLKGRTAHQIRFALRDLTFDELTGDRYEVTFTYDSSAGGYPADAGMLTTKVVSNRLVFVRTDKGWQWSE